MGKLIFILGGARAGKSSFAFKMAQKSGKKVTFIATATPLDSEMRKRIKVHKNARPRSWKTIEITNNLDKKIGQEKNGVILVDCLTIYIYHLMKPPTTFRENSSNKRSSQKVVGGKILSHVKKIIRAIKKTRSKTIVVSNEVGCGIVPRDKLSRDYRDVLGKVNQMVALAADEFYLMFAGIPIDIKKLYGKLKKL